MRYDRITVEPATMGGVPCIRGLRFPVATIVAMVAEGMKTDEILADIRIWRPKTSVRHLSTPLGLSGRADFRFDRPTSGKSEPTPIALSHPRRSVFVKASPEASAPFR